MFKQIDENYPRKEHFHHYMKVTRCSYSLVIDLDITKLHSLLKEKKLKVYPVQIYLLARHFQVFGRLMTKTLLSFIKAVWPTLKHLAKAATYFRNLICQRTCSIFQVYLGLILLLLTLMYLQKRLIYCQYLR